MMCTQNIQYSGKGFFLPAAAVLAAFCAVVSLLIYFDITSTAKSLRAEVHSGFARSEAVNGVLAELQKQQAFNTFSCLLTGSSHGFIKIERRLCSAASIYDHGLLNQGVIIPVFDDNKAGFPFFNYNYLFKERKPCGTTVSGEVVKSSFGFVLSAFSLRSNYLCTKKIAVGDKTFIINANYEAGESLLVKELKQIAVSGYIDLNTGLEISSDLLISAGGDIHILEPRSTGPGVPALTLLSATGRIVVDSINGAFKLKAIAKEGVFLPAGYLPSGNPLLPPPLKVITLGFG